MYSTDGWRQACLRPWGVKMHPANFTISLLLGLALFLPLSAEASWWGGGDDRRELNLELGYDANTVITVNGRIVAIPSDVTHSQVQAEVETAAGRLLVVLGPRSYWAEHGIDLRVGDEVTVRGSKAQGKDGNIYLLAQTVNETTRGQEVTLRSDAGQPVWAATGMGTHSGRGIGRPNQSCPQPAMRMGGGRMGR